MKVQPETSLFCHSGMVRPRGEERKRGGGRRSSSQAVAQLPKEDTKDLRVVNEHERHEDDEMSKGSRRGRLRGSVSAASLGPFRSPSGSTALGRWRVCGVLVDCSCQKSTLRRKPSASKSGRWKRPLFHPAPTWTPLSSQRVLQRASMENSGETEDAKP